MNNTNNTNIEEKILHSLLSEEDKNEMLAIVRGEKLPNLYSDIIAKKVFSPDEHPERLDFLLQRLMNDENIETLHSAANEGPLQNMYSKKVITDIPAWLKDHRLADLEMQVAAQEYIVNRTDIYASEMLMIQYSAEKGQKKGELNYSEVDGVIIVVLMKNSPKIFREFDSKRYIHRITVAEADSGIRFPLLRKMVFVQLDKALEEFLNEDYSKDEDFELLKMLATIADINNSKVKEATTGSTMYDNIRHEISNFSKNKEVQIMLTEEMLAEADINSMRSAAIKEGLEEGRAKGLEEGRAKGLEEGRAEGQKEVSELYAWLLGENRLEDAKRAASDENFREKLIKEHTEKKD